MARTDYMTTTTTRSKGRRGGFTLTEVIIGATLGTIVMAGVLSTFMMLVRSGANAASYNLMESHSRRALEELSRDLRMASSVTWNSSTSLTLIVPDNYTTTSNRVTYAYDSDGKYFYRMPGIATDTNTKTVLIRNVVDLRYARYDRVDNPSTSNQTTKRIQLTMGISTVAGVTVAVSNNILSASYILRNKPAN